MIYAFGKEFVHFIKYIREHRMPVTDISLRNKQLNESFLFHFALCSFSLWFFFCFFFFNSENEFSKPISVIVDLPAIVCLLMNLFIIGNLAVINNNLLSQCTAKSNLNEKYASFFYNHSFSILKPTLSNAFIKWPFSI